MLGQDKQTWRISLHVWPMPAIPTPSSTELERVEDAMDLELALPRDIALHIVSSLQVSPSPPLSLFFLTLPFWLWVGRRCCVSHACVAAQETDVCSLGSCSRFWRRICGSDALWFALSKRRWPSVDVPLGGGEDELVRKINWFNFFSFFFVSFVFDFLYCCLLFCWSW